LREAAITLPDGSKGILAVSNDITGRKRAEQSKLDMERQVLHLQKLESLGVLAGGIAHDFNNLLAAMLGNVELALMDVAEDSPAQKSLKTALAAGRRAAKLTRQMLDYSGRGHIEVSEVNLSQMVHDLTELLKVSISKSASLELYLIEDLPVIQADTNQLQQVVVNLITNASEAIGDQQGIITITTNVCECDSNYLATSRLVVKPQPGTYVYLEVSDTGCGMDESVQEKLFDPFFTTKFVGRGLGMAGVLGVIQGHGGAIMVSSQPGKGTAIRVLLPIRPAQPTDTQLLKASSVHPLASMPMLSGTVLVAEDEPQLRTFAESLLKRMGLHVVSVSDGEQAVALFKQHAEEITFVLLDLTMPKLDGLKTLAEIRRLRPGVRAVLTSGYDGADITWHHAEQGFDAFIQKPYKLEELTRLVHQMCVPPP
jgi:signal transduction histidine kinase/CheY-like chemotaxis protein